MSNLPKKLERPAARVSGEVTIRGRFFGRLTTPVQLGAFFLCCFRSAKKGHHHDRAPTSQRVSIRLPPHKMRRTVLTLIECNGENATAFAGHSSRKVTEVVIHSTMVLAHADGDWPRGLNPERNGKRSWLKKIFGAGG